MVLKRVDMAEYRRGAGLRPKRSRRGKELYLQDTRRSLQNPAAPDAAQRSLATPRRYSRGALYRLWLLRRGFASCQRARIGFCIPGRPRTSAIRLCHGGETQVLSSTGKRAGSSAFQRLRRGGRLDSARAAGICPPPESRRSGGRRCSAASSITAEKRPQFPQSRLFLPPLMRQSSPSRASAPACRGGAARRCRSPQMLRP
jgi:hypothetical protein